MIPARIQSYWYVPVFLIAVAALAGGIWRYGYLQALDQLARRAEADLALASDRLSTQLQVDRELAVLMAGHPALRTEAPRDAARTLLLDMADKTGALDIFYADIDGSILASAQGGPGSDLTGTPYFRRALHGALGSHHGIFGPLRHRAYFHAAPTFGADGAVIGVLVVVADIEDIEQAWRGETPAVFFTDNAGEVFITNRSELLFWTRPPGQSGLRPAGGEPVAFQDHRVGLHEIWSLDWGPYLPHRALHMQRDLPVIGLKGEVLVDVAPARRLAGLQAAAVAAICLAFGALLFLATVRRRTLAEANAVLETRVAERTEALSSTNAQLRREVAERQEAEAALKRAQADLVQAGKLSALGQMSAGISHELNQPLMAIRSYAENGTEFLARGKPEVAGENLGRISDLARRMGRIIQNLRAFARNEAEPVGKVDLVQVINTAVELSEARLKSEAVKLEWAAPDFPVYVRGGEVRLVQVFVNLINNAADAMTGQDRRFIRIAIDQSADRLSVSVRDIGPGIKEPEKLFEPFYTTKAVGSSEGMGLGLSISYGLVQSFGGNIRGMNVQSDGGGALFVVDLEHWHEAEVAA
ncbi:sensor histidine kinase [Arenibacterium sp. CAU 1754]